MYGPTFSCCDSNPSNSNLQVNWIACKSFVLGALRSGGTCPPHLCLPLMEAVREWAWTMPTVPGRWTWCLVEFVGCTATRPQHDLMLVLLVFIVVQLRNEQYGQHGQHGQHEHEHGHGQHGQHGQHEHGWHGHGWHGHGWHGRRLWMLGLQWYGWAHWFHFGWWIPWHSMTVEAAAGRTKDPACSHISNAWAKCQEGAGQTLHLPVYHISNFWRDSKKDFKSLQKCCICAEIAADPLVLQHVPTISMM